MSSISGINGALGDMGQNYKNLALIIQAAGVAYDETTLFGCPPPPPAAAPAPLPSELVGAWRRDFERYGPSASASLRVHYVQGASLFELLEPEGGGAIRRTRGAGGDPTRRGGGRFNRLALAELHRWPACKSRLAVAAAAAGAARLSRHSG